MAAVDQLTKLMKDCLVMISGQSDGSGFFIAPGTILTCAHVAGPIGAEVEVTWREHTRSGVVRWASEVSESGTVPYPDLAVVELGSPPGHPMVWLDDRLPSLKDDVVIFGHARIYHDEPDQASGQFRVGGEYGEMIRVIADELVPGMSGAPVLNATTGGVCAVTKATRGRGHPAGGVVIPLRALRLVMEPAAYQRARRANHLYHQGNPQWDMMLDDVPGAAGPLSRDADAELRLLLGQLPEVEPARHLATFKAVVGEFAVEPRHPMYDYGDVLVELSEMVPPVNRFPRALAYVIALSRTPSPVAERLRQWARDFAPREHKAEVVTRLGEARAGTRPDRAAARPSVIVCVRHFGVDRRRYQCELWQFSDQIRSLESDDKDRSLDELREYLQDRLPALIRGLPADQHPMIELVLPVELLDVDVEQWPAAPGRNDWAVLGHTSPVVVREVERFDDEEGYHLPDWARRWAQLDGRDMNTVLTTVECTERRTSRSWHAWFQDAATTNVVVLPRSPQDALSDAVLEVAVSCGIPVMIWRRRGCVSGAAREPHDCPGKRLSAAVTEQLAGATREEVPERIRQMRYRAEAGSGPESGMDVVLLWDDPGRRPPRPLLLPPTGEPHADR
ncbi:trypsin-like peptidase domain-containing protein [Actinoplanes sp. NPDC024001]|uniref:VMAP-C domain-containing protein n=1 Tax=Actinoplanes sp. NPDC024001 TaxID=3154598 RepID=UPI003410F3AB